jgi:hypothetical protein
MASRISHPARNCARCGKLVLASTDHIRAYKWANSLIWHWSCFSRLMAEQDQVTARELWTAEQRTSA